MTTTKVKTGKVLVVEDDEAILGIVSRILDDSGCDVHAAHDGREAMSLLTQDFDTIISDISMPGMTGIQLLRAVRDRNLDVPVVLMTGDPSLETAVQAIEFGAVRYITKPFNTKILTQVVEEAIKLGRMARFKREAFTLLGGEPGQLADRVTREAAFDRGLSTLWIAYQPIVRVSEKKLVAYECLLRNEESTLANPALFIETAEQLGRLHELGREIRRQIAATISESDPSIEFFVNLHLRDLLDEELFAANSPLTQHAARIVLEVTERASLESIPDTRARILRLRDIGFRIAIDDLGAGYAGLSCFALLSPEVVKLDMFLIRNIDADPTKQRLVRSMAELCRDLGMQVICEGVETPAERDALIALGCYDLQGYLFARPARRFPTIQW